ncbi:DUF1302 family protein [Marinomonas sp. C1424]|uniref:DUF1302 family protein n=2 Tax=Marinomonas transparens TaxID=2795388 RepID=A0A934JM06_9GAMM|nr:DUF1302 family protein [Marinomonas transparens]
MPFRLKALAIAIVSSTSTAYAFQIDTANSDVRMSFNNTVKYSTAFRLKNQSDLLSGTDGTVNGVGADAKNFNDGNNNFNKGVVSNRLDLLSEFDLSYQERFGLRVSGAAWYDAEYHKKNDNTSDTSNAYVTDEFLPSTRRTMGEDSEFLDAFVYARFPVKDGMEGTLRAGRHSLLWGESLFYGMNSVAASNGPMDIVKLTSVPGSTTKETIRPTGKVSIDLPLTEDVSLGAYIGYEWEKSRLPPSGAYLAAGDPVEGIKIKTPAGELKNESDLSPSDSGQYGLQLKVTDFDLDIDYGFYATRYHSATPANNYFYIEERQFAGGMAGPPVKGSYRWVYAEGIESYGASLAKTVGRWSLAGEVSYRRNAPLASYTQDSSDVGGINRNYNGTDNPGYAVGETAHAQFSWLANVPTFISREAVFLGEVAWNTRVKTTKNEAMLNPYSDKSAMAVRMIFKPTYRQVFDGVDLSPSIGVSHTVGKSSAIGPAFGVDGGGDINLGLSAVYLNKWNFTMNYVSYYGQAAPFQIDGKAPNTNPPKASYLQPLKDRDFISASVSTTF